MVRLPRICRMCARHVPLLIIDATLGRAPSRRANKFLVGNNSPDRISRVLSAPEDFRRLFFRLAAGADHAPEGARKNPGVTLQLVDLFVRILDCSERRLLGAAIAGSSVAPGRAKWAAPRVLSALDTRRGHTRESPPSEDTNETLRPYVGLRLLRDSALCSDRPGSSWRQFGCGGNSCHSIRFSAKRRTIHQRPCRGDPGLAPN